MTQVISRHGIGIVPGDKFFHVCCFAGYLSPGPPRRLGRVRDYPNRGPGFARLVSWVRQLQQDKRLVNGEITPFRIVLLEDVTLYPLLNYLAGLEEPIGDIDILTAGEIVGIADSLGSISATGVLDAEFVARLSIERRDFGEWVGELGLTR